MKRLYEALFLGFAVLALAQSSGIWFLGIFFLLWIAVGFALHRQKKTPNYKKAVAYAMILPFALWWFLSPNTRGHFFSPWLFVIPSWYFMSLAILQWQSSGKGGFGIFPVQRAFRTALFAPCDRQNFGVLPFCVRRLFAFQHQAQRTEFSLCHFDSAFCGCGNRASLRLPESCRLAATSYAIGKLGRKIQKRTFHDGIFPRRLSRFFQDQFSVG